MDVTAYLNAALLGLVEGLTEFIPVSSTGHLILLSDLLGFEGPGSFAFKISIQFGAILAIIWLYRARFIRVATGLLQDPQAQRFTINILVAFLPAVVIGVFANEFIERVLFDPWVVVCTLFLGGLAILAIERWHPAPTVESVDDIRPSLAVKVGFCQCVAMIPGVSRSGATIMGALMLRCNRAAATEFSFFLAVPTMLAAASYALYKHWASISPDDLELIAIGFVCAFVAAMVVVRSLVAFVSKHGFAPFAYYRIGLAIVMAILLSQR